MHFEFDDYILANLMEDDDLICIKIVDGKCAMTLAPSIRACDRQHDRINGLMINELKKEKYKKGKFVFTIKKCKGFYVQEISDVR